MIAEAQGTSDVLSASFTPKLEELKNGTLVHVRAKEKNRTKTPLFKADETRGKVIVKGNNLSLEEGDIAGAGHWLELQYDEALDKWVLQNPAKGITPSSGVPVGTIEYFAMATPPAGYLKADGAAVGKDTYPDLFAAIGTTFGAGDGLTTFNLPDLLDRFAQGSTMPGRKITAGLPNIKGVINNPSPSDRIFSFGGEWNMAGTSDAGALTSKGNLTNKALAENEYSGGCALGSINFDASRSNPIYSASDTVQPPALTLLPCIKAFNAATNPGLIDLTELAQEMANKTDKSAAAHAAMPSDNYIDLTLPISGGTITVPAAGYLLAKLTGNNAGYFSVDSYRGGTYIASHISIYAFGAYFLFCPVAAGNIAKIYNTTSTTSEFFRFIYAEGSKA